MRVKQGSESLEPRVHAAPIPECFTSLVSANSGGREEGL